MSATVISLGATLHSVVVPDRHGDRADVALGFAALDGYRGRFPLGGKNV